MRPILLSKLQQILWNRTPLVLPTDVSLTCMACINKPPQDLVLQRSRLYLTSEAEQNGMLHYAHEQLLYDDRSFVYDLAYSGLHGIAWESSARQKPGSSMSDWYIRSFLRGSQMTQAISRAGLQLGPFLALLHIPKGI